jgi:hypothetical protein
MTGSSILPACFCEGKLYFLFGKENPKEDSAKGFSDFGGKVESTESIYKGALREGGEELTGFLGDEDTLEKHIRKNGGVYTLSHHDYHVHIFHLKYDPKLPVYYNQNHRFLWNRMNRDLLNRTKLFEKIEIQWFSIQNMKSRIREFRSFYQDIVRELIRHENHIRRFLRKAIRKTKRVYPGGKKTKKQKNSTIKKR